MMMNKKSQGISITTIIIAVLALIVLVVLIGIFVGKVGIFSEDTEKIGDTSQYGLGTKGLGESCEYKDDDGSLGYGTCSKECIGGRVKKTQVLVSEHRCQTGLICCL